MAIKFNTTGDYVDFGDITTVSGLTQFSVACWAYPTQDSSSLQYPILSKMNSSAENLRNFLSGIELRLDASGFRLKIFSSSRLITKNNMAYPILFIEVD
jgi:hypothetical protein